MSRVDSSSQVSWMLLLSAVATATTCLDRKARSRGNKEPKLLYNKPPFTTYTARGTNSTGRKSKCSQFAFKSGMSNHCHIIQDTHYSSHKEPESQSSHYNYNQSRPLHVKPKSLEHHSTSTPPFKKVLSSKLFPLYNFLGLTSVGWSSLRLFSRTAASVKLDSGSQVASSIG